MQIGRCEEFQSWRFERKPYVRAKDSSEQKTRKLVWIHTQHMLTKDTSKFCNGLFDLWKRIVTSCSHD